jgi:hypothetical protein
MITEQKRDWQLMSEHSVPTSISGTRCSELLTGGEEIPYKDEMNQSFYQLLIEEFKLRQKRNASYSMRAFARDLGIGLGSISEVLSGKRELSKSNFEKALGKMQLTDEQKILLRSAQANGKINAPVLNRDLYLSNPCRKN